MPKIYIGEPNIEDRSKYKVMQVETIIIYYPSRLKIKNGYVAIKVTLKKMLFVKWLELEGAMGIVKVD